MPLILPGISRFECFACPRMAEHVVVISLAVQKSHLGASVKFYACKEHCHCVKLAVSKTIGSVIEDLPKIII